MALLNSLFAGVSGLKNHQSLMDVIGNNIANVNTIGFKGSRVTFCDTFNQFVKTGTNPTETTGGTNSFQIGLGMKVNSIDRNWNQGTFERTGITTDMALQGPGMFVLKSDGRNYYSRAGAFIFDGDGKLVSSQNGAVVQGKVANEDGVVPPGNNLEDIVIDKNMKLPAIATTNIEWGGNLRSNSDLTRSVEIIQRGNIKASDAGPFDITTKVYNSFGEEFDFIQTLTKTSDNNYDITWEVQDSSGASLATSASAISVTFADDGSGNYAMNDASKALFDDTANRINLSAGVPNGDLDFTYDSTLLTNNDTTSTISSSADGNRTPNVVSGSVTIYDSLGISHQITLAFSKIGDNEWAWHASVPGTSTIDGLPVDTDGTLSFNSDGTLDPANISPNNPQISFIPEGGANIANITLDFGSGFGGVTQTSASSVVSSLSQNGAPSASLSNINIDQYGNVLGVFSNGNSKTLAQIMVATFSNLNGLISEGDNMFSAYANSGDPRIGEFGESTSTTVQSGALEQSNVDLSEEFTRMIVSQRGFQANARVITTADSLLQEITNLIR